MHSTKNPHKMRGFIIFKLVMFNNTHHHHSEIRPVSKIDQRILEAFATLLA